MRAVSAGYNVCQTRGAPDPLALAESEFIGQCGEYNAKFYMHSLRGASCIYRYIFICFPWNL